MARITVKVEMKGIYSYQAPAYGYGYETRYIYNMVAEDGTVYVWKTSSSMSIEVPYTGKPGCHNFEDRKGNPIDYQSVNKGDVITITATVKGQGEYKGQPQTELTRVKVTGIETKAQTPEQIKAEQEERVQLKKQEQLDSLEDGDFVWNMPYRQYKEHYSDCETLAGSFEKNDFGSTITVIIRDGRLKASGVRGGHYSGYEFFFEENGKKTRVCYRAISEETALKRLYREFKDAQNVTPGKIYMYC